MSTPDEPGGSWTLLTGHGHVLVEIARNPRARIRDISAVAGITERTVQAIVADLEAAGYITRSRTGRRTQYTVNPDSLFRHPAQDGHRVGPFLTLLAAAGDKHHHHTPNPVTISNHGDLAFGDGRQGTEETRARSSTTSA
jgi:hypothetical protein